MLRNRKTMNALTYNSKSCNQLSFSNNNVSMLQDHKIAMKIKILGTGKNIQSFPSQSHKPCGAFDLLKQSIICQPKIIIIVTPGKCLNSGITYKNDNLAENDPSAITPHLVINLSFKFLYGIITSDKVTIRLEVVASEV